MREQLTVFDETEFKIENWRLEGQGLVEEFLEIASSSGASAQRKSHVNWRIGDWLLFGRENLANEKEFENEAESILKAKNRRTIWDFIRTARAFPESRRRDSLSWSHHKEIATANFDTAKRDALLNWAEEKKLSVVGLREVANKEGKVAKKGAWKPEEKPFQQVEISFSESNFQWLTRLSRARGVDQKGLLFSIFLEYFRTNKEPIIKEIEENEAAIAKAQQKSRDERKADKLREKAAMGDPKRIELERYTKWLRDEVGSKAAELLSEYLNKECGTAIIWQVPVPIIEAVFAKLGDEKDPHATLKALEALARPQTRQPGFTQS